MYKSVATMRWFANNAITTRLTVLCLTRRISSHKDVTVTILVFFFFSSRRRHTRFKCDWSSDVCSSDLEAVRGTHAGPEREFRRGPWLSVPVFVLHDHQRAGPQVALPLGRRRGASGASQLGAGDPQILHYQRQLRAQRAVGGDLRSLDRASGEGRDSARSDDPGRHPLPQNRKLHREGEASRCHAGIHWIGKY